MLLLNFSHLITATQQAQIEATNCQLRISTLHASNGRQPLAQRADELIPGSKLRQREMLGK